jgi:glycosyltransferase involved in cell wall biosynthesis
MEAFFAAYPAATVAAPPPRVTMLLYSPFEYDSRVLREIRSLIGAGFVVRLIATRRAGQPASEQLEGARVDRVLGSVRELLALLRSRRRGPSPHEGELGEGVDLHPPTASPLERAAGRRGRLGRLVIRSGAIASWRLFAANARRAGGSEPADVWYAHDLDTLPIAAALRRQFGGGLVYDSHELFVDAVLDPPRLELERRWWRRREGRLIREADRVFVDIPSRGRILAERYAVPPPEVIMNVPSFRPPPERAGRLHARLSGEPGRIALYAGGLTEGRERGLASTVKALPLLPGDLGLVLIGPGDPAVAARLSALAAGLGVSERLHLLPPVHPDEIREQIADADIGLVPFVGLGLNNYHSLPTKLFDYLSSGLPVAASDFPDMRELIARHQVGTTFDPEDPASIAGALTELLDDPERLRRSRENAAAAARLYRWENEERKLLEAVRSLVPAAALSPPTGS